MFVWSENGANKTKDILGARMKIMWEEQLVDPPIAYINHVMLKWPPYLDLVLCLNVITYPLWYISISKCSWTAH